jgi:group I intron endonuclease
MLIYKTVNRLNGKFYIGQEKNYNPRYFGSGIYLIRAIEKYGLENFTKEIIEDKIETKQLLNEREIFWIDFFDSRNPKKGYNIASGGQGGDFLSQELKDKRGIKISEVRKGKHLSDAHKKAIQKAFEKPRKEKTGKRSGEKNGFFGKSHSGDKTRFGTGRKGKLPSNARTIIDDRGNEYNSAIEAAKQFQNPDTARRAISEVCKGQRSNYRGIVFRFK